MSWTPNTELISPFFQYCRHQLICAACFNFCSFSHVLRVPTVDVGYVPNAKYLAHIPHQTQKTAPIRCGICAKIIPFVSVLYRCKFVTVRIDVVKQNNVLYSAFSLLSLLVLISSLSLLTSDPASLNREKTK